MRACRILAALILLLICRTATSQQQSRPATAPELEPLPAADMSPKDCGVCHESQYQTWTTARHNERGVACAVCHGAFHSGSLNGCLACHTGKHKLQYKNWEFVKDYMVEGDISNYYCITCHDPHNPAKEKVLLCNGCHGNSTVQMQPRKTIGLSLQETHNIMARIAPEMDDDTWNHRLKSTPAKLMMGGGVLLIASLLLFPYFYTLVAFVRWVRKRRQKS